MQQGRIIMAMIVMFFAVGVFFYYVSGIAMIGMVVPEFRKTFTGPMGDNIDADTKIDADTMYNNIIFYWNTLPYLLYFMIVVWAIVMLIRGEPQQQYGGGL